MSDPAFEAFLTELTQEMRDVQAENGYDLAYREEELRLLMKLAFVAVNRLGYELNKKTFTL
jgi:hypothetical protein